MIWEAATDGHSALLADLLASPGLTAADINFQYGFWLERPLNQAIRRGFEDCVRLLVSHPLVEINYRTPASVASLYRACSHDRPYSLGIVKTLCGHPHIDLNVVDVDNTTPLWIACHMGQTDTVRFLLAHAGVGRLDVTRRANESSNGDDPFTNDWEGKTALEVAPNSAIREIMTLYLADPRQTRRALRKELGLSAEDAAADFVSAVLLCDGYLRLGQKVSGDREARFLSVVSRLPLELQMIICYRRHDSRKDIIITPDVERALQKFISELHDAVSF